LRLARTAWRGRKNPAGLIKEQLEDPPPESGVRPPEAAVKAAAPPVHPVMAPPPVAAPVRAEVDPAHVELLLLLR
jgi:hypothetical protein